jgi:hypothetical protein
MLPYPLPMHHRSSLAGGLKARIKAVGLSKYHRSLGLAVWPMFGELDGCRCTSGPIPTWSAVQPHRVGALIAGHDVSWTATQTLGRAMQLITTMMPV